jgi:ribosomal protein S18 acetylase RimI-like enzyme
LTDPATRVQAASVIQTQVCVRTAGERDAQAVRSFLVGLSTYAQYQRFFTGLGAVSPSLVRQLVAAMPRRHSVVAVLGNEVIAHGMAAVNAAGEVELGVVVAEAHRRRGLATQLVRMLLDRAAAAGAGRLRMDVLCENTLVLDWIRRGLPDTEFLRDGHTLTGLTVLGAVPVATSPAA